MSLEFKPGCQATTQYDPSPEQTAKAQASLFRTPSKHDISKASITISCNECPFSPQPFTNKGPESTAKQRTKTIETQAETWTHLACQHKPTEDEIKQARQKEGSPYTPPVSKNRRSEPRPQTQHRPNPDLAVGGWYPILF